MITYRSFDEIPEGAFSAGTAVAIGKFDGIHLGHAALLARLGEVAEREGLEPVVLTFTNNPLSVLRPEASPPPIMSQQQRLDELERQGVKTCVMVPFDAELAEVSAEDFVQRVLVDLLQVRYLCLGTDFRFGHAGLGDRKLLARMGDRFGYQVEVIEDIADEELGRVSSSRIREAILQGDVGAAAHMLGRLVAVRGTVVHGDSRGRELGFPTANVGPGDSEIEGLVPAEGVYAGWAIIDGVPYQAAISVGVNLTFDPEGDPRVEAYLLDFEGDLYGSRIEVRFLGRLRGMVAFSGIDALVARMHEDVRETRAILIGQHP